jgi:putative zinc finger/helix-turn-helix YgiT family protein
MKCPVCGSAELTITHEPYKYDESGLPNVTLANIEIRRCGKCGEELPAIPRVAELHKAIARALARRHAKLSGAEVRFLRKYLGHSGADFATLIGVTRETVSRWENDKEPIGGTSDRLLRLLVVLDQRVQDYDAVEQFANIDAPSHATPLLSFSKVGSSWHPQAA